MDVKELSKEQVQQLKIMYLDNKLYEEEQRGISYGEIIAIDALVSDDIIYSIYKDYTFTPEDFF